MFELFEFNYSSLFLIVQVKDPSDSIFGSELSSVWADHIDEFLKCEFFIGFPQCCDDVNNVRIPLVKAEFLENFTDLRWVDDSAAIFIKDKKCLSEEFIVFWGNSLFPLCGYFFSVLGASGGLVKGCGHDFWEVLWFIKHDGGFTEFMKR